MLELKRRLQPPHGRIGWKALDFLWALFVSSVWFLVFLKEVVFSWTALLQLVVSAFFISQFSRSNSILRKVFLSWFFTLWCGDPHSLLADTISEKWFSLGRQISGIWARYPPHHSQWWVVMFYRLSIFVWSSTSLWSSPATYYLMESVCWCFFGRVPRSHRHTEESRLQQFGRP